MFCAVNLSYWWFAYFVVVWSLSHVRLFVTLWTVACQALLSMGFFRQEYCSGLPFPSLVDLPNLEIKSHLINWQADSLSLRHQGGPQLLFWINFMRHIGLQISFPSRSHIMVVLMSGKWAGGVSSFLYSEIVCEILRLFVSWFLGVSWTARRSNQSILKEFNPEYLLEGLMMKLKLQYFGHLMQGTDSLEKKLMLGKTEHRRRRRQQRMRWLDGITDLMDMNFNKF